MPRPADLAAHGHRIVARRTPDRHPDAARQLVARRSRSDPAGDGDPWFHSDRWSDADRTSRPWGRIRVASAIGGRAPSLPAPPAWHRSSWSPAHCSWPRMAVSRRWAPRGSSDRRPIPRSRPTQHPWPRAGPRLPQRSPGPSALTCPGCWPSRRRARDRPPRQCPSASRTSKVRPRPRHRPLPDRRHRRRAPPNRPALPPARRPQARPPARHRVPSRPGGRVTSQRPRHPHRPNRSSCGATTGRCTAAG